jgi:hypothetical protein
VLLASSPQQVRWEKASTVKQEGLRRVDLPRLEAWNYGPCPDHEVATPECEFRKCGGDFFDHQTKSIAWAYLGQLGIEASVPGSGKTNVVLGLLSLLKHLKEPLKAVIVVQTSAVAQWTEEAQRFAPGLRTQASTSGLSKSKRLALYSGDWEVLIMGYHIMTRDVQALLAVEPKQMISDDVDPLLNDRNATARAFNLLAEQAERVLVCNATNLQTRLQQLYHAATPIGGKAIFGSIESFERRYVKREPVYFTVTTEGRGGVTIRETKKTFKATGYKNLNDFRERFSPMVYRTNYDDLTDVRLPEVMPPTLIWRDMYPAQRAKYELLQQGVLELIKENQPPEQKAISALAKYNHGSQICTGLPALGEPDGPGASAKLDWLEQTIVDGDWSDRKVVAFIKNIGSVQALHARLENHGVGYATIWGPQSKAEHRAAEQKRFWEDRNCRVMIGTSAMERSLNLQIANIMCFVDTIPNPARMHQLLGRERRAGSIHSHVWPFYLLTPDSQEERYLKVLGTRQAVVDAVNNEDSGELFERLSPDELLRLITP